MKLVFMGTPAFALPALRALIGSSHEVVAVYTQPPRPAGRGKKPQASPVQELTEKNGIPVYSPVSLKDKDVQKTFADHKADAAIVAAYGLILPKAILEAYAHGCLNIHPSLLPRWRGAAPIQRTLMAGDEETGVCIMQMDAGLDTGDVIAMETYDVPKGCTAGELHDTLADMGASLLLQSLKYVEQGTVVHTAQSEEGVTYANKISKDEARIDWTRPAADLIHHIYGLSPYPGAYFIYQGERIKILRATLTKKSGTAGTTLDDQLTVACGKDAITPLTLQRQGKAALDCNAFLRGFAIPAGTLLE